METFTKIKKFEENPNYYKQRQKSIDNLNIDIIDKPIINLIKWFLKLPYCFTIQSCFGHFLYNGQENTYNFGRIPESKNIKSVEYRIAYIAICIQNSNSGKTLFEELRSIPKIDYNYIQFGCAEWFWERQVNSYVLQVEPGRHSKKDTAFIAYEEALYIEKIRDKFFRKLGNIIQKNIKN